MSLLTFGYSVQGKLPWGNCPFLAKWFINQESLMPLPDTKAREIVFQLLYSKDMAAEQESSAALISKQLAIARSQVALAMEKVAAIQKCQEEIDTLIANTVQNYAFQRIQRVERNILRLGIYELVFEKTTPPKISITEAMRLARKFATAESAHFVNAILDHIYKGQLGEKQDSEAIENSFKAMSAYEELATEKSKEQKN